jgi:hypothetical protein
MSCDAARQVTMTKSVAFHQRTHLLAPQISNGGCLAGFFRTPDYGFVRD